MTTHSFENPPNVPEDTLRDQALRWLPDDAVYVDSSQPSASERMAATWPMDDQEREGFRRGIEDISAQYRDMGPEEIRAFLARIATP